MEAALPCFAWRSSCRRFCSPASTTEPIAGSSSRFSSRDPVKQPGLRMHMLAAWPKVTIRLATFLALAAVQATRRTRLPESGQPALLLLVISTGGSRQHAQGYAAGPDAVCRATGRRRACRMCDQLTAPEVPPLRAAAQFCRRGARLIRNYFSPAPRASARSPRREQISWLVDYSEYDVNHLGIISGEINGRAMPGSSIPAVGLRQSGSFWRIGSTQALSLG